MNQMDLSQSPSQGDKSASERRESDETLSDGVGGGEDTGLENKEVKKDSEMSLDVFRSSKIGTQELTLSYMSDTGNGCVIGEKDDNRSNSFNFHEKELMEKVSVGSHKGKEVVVDDGDDCRKDGGWVVERDFLSLSDVRANSSKRAVEEDVEKDGDGDKKRKMETLNLSLSLPDVSLSLNGGGGGQIGDTSGAVAGQTRPRVINSVQAISNNNTQTSFSNDFTAASMSYSYSHPFSHNPSCSLTHNSTSNFEYSVGRESDQIWNCGEGTNGSVHSRFKPIGDGVGFANQGGEGISLVQGGRVINKESGNNHNNNSLYRAASIDNVSFFPSDLPARPRIDGPSEISRGKSSENVRVVESFDMGRVNKLTRPERILWEIVSESVPVMTQIVQELTDEVVASVKNYLKNLILVPDSDKKKELGSLQSKLERRSDLSKETLIKANRYHLELLVSIKTGLASFLSPQIRLPTTELVEIFLLTRCRNVNCKSLLPVEDCDCKICSTNKGFCSSCMCPVCLQFDCASNTCSWVGCDMCSHWCHAACGIQRNLIRPSQSSKGPPGNTEMQFHCIGCDHASEMFGFVKDVFMCCAKDWGVETLKKEIDCVRKIFKGSADFRGKQLQSKANEMISKLENRMISPADACSSIIQFFNYADESSQISASSASLKELSGLQTGHRKEPAQTPPAISLPPKFTSVYNNTGSSPLGLPSLLPLQPKDLKASLLNDLKTEKELRFSGLSTNEGFDSLESLVRAKEAEAKIYQNRADEARREAEGYRRMVRVKSEQLEEEYSNKLAKLCLQETEERRRKKLEELKMLESSHRDYYKMKMRMQADIASMLERMESTKQKWV